jgi:tagatose 6-phosphate kinase
MILCIGMTPASQRVMVFRRLQIDAVNRAARTVDGVAGKVVNVTKVLRELGESVVGVGFFGGDRGAEIRAELEHRGIKLEAIMVEGRTRQCITVIDESAGTITELVEEGRPVTAEDCERLMEAIRRHVENCRAMIMSGTLAVGAPANFYRKCVEMAHAKDSLSVVDAQGPPLVEALKAHPGLVKPNRTELETTLGRPLPEESHVIGAMRELHGLGAERVVVTAGKHAALAFDGTRFWRIEPPQVRTVNPIGSGDAFTATLVSRLVKGEDLGEACRWGAAAGAANALNIMAGELHRSDVERLAKEVVVRPVAA